MIKKKKVDPAYIDSLSSKLGNKRENVGVVSNDTGTGKTDYPKMNGHSA